MSCNRDAEHCNQIAGQNGQPESVATWAGECDSAGRCDVRGGFLAHNDHTMTMSLAGGGVLGIVDTSGSKGICPKCGSELSVGNGEEDWCLECEEMVTALTDEVAGHIRALGDKNFEVREAAVVALGEIGDPAAVPALTKALRDDKSTSVRWNAATALGAIGDAAAIPALEKALRDGSIGVRGSAAWALGAIGNLAILTLTKTLVGDNNPDTRVYAAEALGKIGDPVAIPVLGKALSEESPKARKSGVRSHQRD